jgi:hypothetical protein
MFHVKQSGLGLAGAAKLSGGWAWAGERPLMPSEQRTFCRYTDSSGIPVLGGLNLEEYLVAEPIQVSVSPTPLKPQLSKPFWIPSFCGLLAWWLRDDRSPAHGQQGRCTLCGRRRRSERASDQQIGTLTKLVGATCLFGPGPDD